MVTKNIRAVTYVPPDYHKKLRQYMKRHNLTESAALVQMIKQFFDGEQPQFNSELKTEVEEILQEQLKLFKEDIDLLKDQMSLMQQLLDKKTSVETTRRSSSSVNNNHPRSLLRLTPKTEEELTCRLGVNRGNVVKEFDKGAEHFSHWSQQKDPSGIGWHRRGDGLYYPV
ncbi:MAG TPA: hypothetical protein DCQ51_00880 [Planktothrix sp. UBA8407]|jgi:hypothetical protein|nr:hypothetical protein [Planktothrix sp. UBA8402]HAO09754.1 hypothetical protein [Planktothrix sp. UBA8407]HBK21132.1 hypothetical protein [Planktothrix sp. UBA10369]